MSGTGVVQPPRGGDATGNQPGPEHGTAGPLRSTTTSAVSAGPRVHHRDDLCGIRSEVFVRDEYIAQLIGVLVHVSSFSCTLVCCSEVSRRFFNAFDALLRTVAGAQSSRSAIAMSSSCS